MSAGKWIEKHPWMTFFLASSAIGTVGSIISGKGLNAFGPFRDVTPGSSGPEVSDWQTNLQDLGYPVTITGVYDDATWSATVNFKMSVGLPANGVVDSATIEAMGTQFDLLAGTKGGLKPEALEAPVEIVGYVRRSPLMALGLLLGAGTLAWAATRKPSKRRSRR